MSPSHSKRATSKSFSNKASKLSNDHKKKKSEVLSPNTALHNVVVDVVGASTDWSDDISNHLSTSMSLASTNDSLELDVDQFNFSDDDPNSIMIYRDADLVGLLRRHDMNGVFDGITSTLNLRLKMRRSTITGQAQVHRSDEAYTRAYLSYHIRLSECRAQWAREQQSKQCNDLLSNFGGRDRFEDLEDLIYAEQQLRMDLDGLKRGRRSTTSPVPAPFSSGSVCEGDLTENLPSSAKKAEKSIKKKKKTKSSDKSKTIPHNKRYSDDRASVTSASNANDYCPSINVEGRA